VASSYTANRRRKIAKVKDRAEVRGGGRKPWRQKGTGQARHGSIRSPLWKGGGVTHGPRPERNFGKTITRKMKRKALFMVLSSKAKESLLMVLDELAIAQPKTKLMVGILNNIFLKQGSGLVVIPKYDGNIIKSIRNITGVSIMEAKDLNAWDLLQYKYLLMPKDAIKTIKETFLK
jgi:large subunit ribosomal protein L4